MIGCHAVHTLWVLLRYGPKACGNTGMESLIRLFEAICWRTPYGQSLPRDLPGSLKLKGHDRREA